MQYTYKGVTYTISDALLDLLAQVKEVGFTKDGKTDWTRMDALSTELNDGEAIAVWQVWYLVEKASSGSARRTL